MEKHHRLRRDPSWDPNGCNICGKVGHQAATCTVGTVDWRERLRTDKLFMWWFKPKRLQRPPPTKPSAAGPVCPPALAVERDDFGHVKKKKRKMTAEEQRGGVATKASVSTRKPRKTDIESIKGTWKKDKELRKLAKKAKQYAKGADAREEEERNRRRREAAAAEAAAAAAARTATTTAAAVATPVTTNSGPGQRIATLPPPSTNPPPRAPQKGPWVQITDKLGRKYFWNRASNITSWQQPPGWIG